MELQMFECTSCNHVVEKLVKADPAAPSPWIFSGLHAPE